VTQLVVMFAIMGLLMPGTDNYAHAGGFLGYAASAVLNPFTRRARRPSAGCRRLLVATLLAIVASLLHGSALIQ
jgi:membrane associated rhomboid family serine protease